MALSIKTDEADALARELAALTHETLTEAVTQALRERLERVQKQKTRMDIAFNIQRIQAEYAALPVHDTRTPDEILGYDEHGLPT